MSARINSLSYGQGDDPREVELILNLILKTREGKIHWAKQANALTASIPGGFQVNFVLGPILMFVPHASSWQLLTVRDKNENELVRVTNGNFMTVLAGASGSELIAAAEQLFQVVSGAAGEELDHAIKIIKNL